MLFFSSLNGFFSGVESGELSLEDFESDLDLFFSPVPLTLIIVHFLWLTSVIKAGVICRDNRVSFNIYNKKRFKTTIQVLSTFKMKILFLLA